MKLTSASIFGGLGAGLLVSIAMIAGRKSGATGKTLDRDASDWIDANTGSYAHVGKPATDTAEFGNHLVASAAFGAVYGQVRARFPQVPPIIAGSIYGSALYAVNIVGVAPLIGLTEGERSAGVRRAGERYLFHLLFGATLALVTDRLVRQDTPSDSGTQRVLTAP